MTTILADFKSRTLVADSNQAEGDRVRSVRKIVRAKGMLMAGAGTVSEFSHAIEWFKSNGLDHPKETPPPMAAGSAVLILAPGGLYIYDEAMPVPQRVASGIEAIGTGAIAALSAYEGIGKRTPDAARRAVRIACKHDSHSRAPVRVAKLSQ